jgi:hypothetical protein
MIADSLPSPQDEITSFTEYARCRLFSLWRQPTVRREVALVVGLLALLFAPALLTWWRRWTLPDSPQGYAVFVLPLALAWLWLVRYRIVLPEFDALNERFTENSVLRFLLEEEPEPARRRLWPFLLGALLTLFAYWTGEPAFTCTAFIALLAGLVVYRLGTQACRVVAFPLLLLLTMIPLPNMLFDMVFTRGQHVVFKMVTHLLQIFGLPADLAIEGNPLQLGSGTSAYQLYAAHTGVGFAEAGVFLLVTIWFLSLVAAPLRARLMALLFGFFWISALLVLRLTLLGWIGTQDGELAASLSGLTRWLLPVIGVAGQWFLLRLFKCRTLSEWVSPEREKAGDAGPVEVPLYPAPARYRTRLLGILGAVTALSLTAYAVTKTQAAAEPIPELPAQVETWKRSPARLPQGDAQRDHPPAAYSLYLSGEQVPVQVSVARATTLNAFRAPYRYLLGPDGMLIHGQEMSIPREGERLPVHQLMILQDRDDLLAAIHWTQFRGDEPILDPLDVPGTIADTLLTHRPLYVCDVWMALNRDVEFDKVKSQLIHFADRLDAQIRSGKP